MAGRARAARPDLPRWGSRSSTSGSRGGCSAAATASTSMGIRVASRRGRKLGPVRALGRAAFCVFFPIGFFWCVISPRRHSVQDIVVYSSVTYDWRPQPTVVAGAPLAAVATDPPRRVRRPRSRMRQTRPCRAAATGGPGPLTPTTTEATDMSTDTVAGTAGATVLTTLASAQFLMTLDSSVMNVSIATVAEDLGTDGHRHPDRDHAVHPGDGDADDHRRQGRADHQQQAGLRDRLRHLRRRFAHDRAGAQPDRDDHRLVVPRGHRRRADHARRRRARGVQLRRGGSTACLRPGRGRRGGRRGGRTADRRLC